MANISKEIDGVVLVNTTPHEISFLSESGEVINVPPCGALINAKVVETEAGEMGSVKLVKSQFVADPASGEVLALIEAEFPTAIIVGSIIAAQAFPGRVFGMTPAPGFERMPPSEKRMSVKKFTTF